MISSLIRPDKKYRAHCIFVVRDVLDKLISVNIVVLEVHAFVQEYGDEVLPLFDV